MKSTSAVEVSSQAVLPLSIPGATADTAADVPGGLTSCADRTVAEANKDRSKEEQTGRELEKRMVNRLEDRLGEFTGWSQVRVVLI